MNLRDNNLDFLKSTYWFTTLLIAIMFFVTGVGNIVPFKHIAQNMTHLGYPAYFLKILGTWKILAALTILMPEFPRVKEWVYAGMFFDLTGATFSRFVIGDALPLILTPLGLAILLAVNYIMQYYLQFHNNRPANSRVRM